MVVEGEVLIREARDAGWEIESQFFAPGSEPLDIPGQIFALAPGVLEKVASTHTPQPHLAIVRVPAQPVDLLTTASFVIVAYEVGDPGNLGTMMRSAEAAGADLLVLCAGTVDATNPKVVRASAGSFFRLPVLTVETLAEVNRPGREILGTSSHLGQDYTSVDLRRDIALVFGNEARGLDADLPVDQWVTIAHRGTSESLNVAMACTILCFEVARQRRLPSGTVGER